MKKKIIKKNLTTLFIIIILFSASSVRSSKLHQEDGIMTNHSTEYVRTLNRNTSTDADAAFYNPAGLAFMAQNGLHISFSSQTYYVKKTHTMDFYALQIGTDPVTSPPHKKSWFEGNMPDEYQAELLAPVLPGFDIVWKQDSWAVFLDVAVMQAALNMTFPNGLAIMDWGALLNTETQLADTDNLIIYTRNANAVRNEMYLGLTLGGAYEIADWLSAGGGLRLIAANGNMKLKMTGINFVTDTLLSSPDYKITKMEDWNVDTSTSGLGFGVILSTHFRPGELLPVAKGIDATLRVEYYPPMKLKKKTNTFSVPDTLEMSGNLDIFKDGSAGKDMTYGHGNGTDTLKVTYPSTVNFGLSYLLLNWIKFSGSGQISLRQMRDLDGRENDYNMGYQAGLGTEFIITPKLILSIGYLYNNFGIKPEKRDEADPLLSSHLIGTGACFKIDENLDINIGGFYQYYIPATVYQVVPVHVSEPTLSYLRKDMNEKRISVSIGATYRLFSSEAALPEKVVDEKVQSKKIPKNKKTSRL